MQASQDKSHLAPQGTTSTPHLPSQAPGRAGPTEGATCCDFLACLEAYRTFTRAASGGVGKLSLCTPEPKGSAESPVLSARTLQGTLDSTSQAAAAHLTPQVW